MWLPSKDVPWTAFLPGAIFFGLGLEALYVLTAYFLQIKLANASERFTAPSDWRRPGSPSFSS